MNDWKYIDEYKELPKEVTSIHCDTRDFCISCLITKHNPVAKEFHNQLGYGTLSDFKFKSEEILPLLKDIETKSGGRGSWRAINIPSYKNWLKYIRFVKDKDKDGLFIAYTNCGDDYTFLSHKMLKEPINEKLLNFIK